MDKLNDILSRYNFIEITNNRSSYTTINLQGKIVLDGTFKLSIPKGDNFVCLRQVRVYFFVKSEGDIPLKGLLNLSQKVNNNWVPIVSTVVTFSIRKNHDLNESCQVITFSPLHLIKDENNIGTDDYEIQINIIPDVTMNTYSALVKGLDRVDNGKETILHPSMSLFYTIRPNNYQEGIKNLFEIITILLSLADKAGIYKNTNFYGCPQQIIDFLSSFDVGSSNIELKQIISSLGELKLLVTAKR